MSNTAHPSTTTARPRVLITGGGAGIGAAAAARCWADGYAPIIIDRNVDAVPAEFVAILADLSSVEDTARALELALSGGPITRLVNNVGIVVPADAASQTLAEFDLAVQLNLRCAFQCMQALLPGMQETRFGRIVNMSSRAALGKDLRTAYAATKAGLIGMTRVWALELGQWGITANAIGPGPIRTELFDKANPPGAERTQKIIQSVPVKRVGTPDDVAHAVAYMLDERSGFVTGQTLYVCGGMTVGVAPV